MAVKTNMLYDALLVPNIGVEAYLGRIGVWQPTGCMPGGKPTGDTGIGVLTEGPFRAQVAGRRLLRTKPLTGHHLGVYGQIFYL